jgi:hypothetical protein
MDQFPKPIQDAMRASGTAATCVPVQIDQGRWESALFIHVAGAECKQDRYILKRAATPTPATLHTELLTHASAAIVLLRLQALTVPDDPLVFEILLTPGEVTSHYECLKLLSQQERLCWFFGDTDYRIIQAQNQEIGAEQHKNFEALSREAFAHDSVLRMTGKYDANAALGEIVSHYELRQNVKRDPGEIEH